LSAKIRREPKRVGRNITPTDEPPKTTFTVSDTRRKPTSQHRSGDQPRPVSEQGRPPKKTKEADTQGPRSAKGTNITRRRKNNVEETGAPGERRASPNRRNQEPPEAEEKPPKPPNNHEKGPTQLTSKGRIEGARPQLDPRRKHRRRRGVTSESRATAQTPRSPRRKSPRKQPQTDRSSGETPNPGAIWNTTNTSQ